jgi:hypothetical protein
MANQFHLYPISIGRRLLGRGILRIRAARQPNIFDEHTAIKAANQFAIDALIRD